ncbi:fimbrial protein [Cronobacter turicensis]|nr:fimbrial protein [Cronobacter turicensis]
MKQLLIFLNIIAFMSQSGICAENMSFHGTLIAPPCIISAGKTIEVSFGNNMGVNKIDGNEYKQRVNYSINCDASYAVNNLAIVVDTSSPAAFDSSAVRTDKSGLGIRILVDGQPVLFARRVAVVDPSSPPIVEAVPVQDQSVTLAEGAFEATMTLRADYL